MKELHCLTRLSACRELLKKQEQETGTKARVEAIVLSAASCGQLHIINKMLELNPDNVKQILVSWRLVRVFWYCLY